MNTGFMGLGRFVGDLDLRMLDDGVNAVTLAEFCYERSDGKRYVVPAGQETDGASIPRALWTAAGSPFTGKYRKAAVVHDHLYRTQQVPKAEADLVLYYGALCAGCSKEQADILWEAVNLCGGKSWQDDAQRLEGGA